jgi:hypothetical protein
MHRRDFLVIGAASTALAGGTASAAVRGSAEWGASGTSRGLDRARFLAWVGERFEIRSDLARPAVAARLVAVEDGPHSLEVDQFSVVFEGEQALPSGLCQLRHADGSSFLLQIDGAGARRRANFGLLRHG